METIDCNHLHFFTAIKSGSGTKACNVNSCGDQAVQFKNLEDVYESEDAKMISSNSKVEHNKVKTVVFGLPEVDRTLWKEDSLFSEFVSHCNDDDDDMSDDPSMTLHQLKGIWRMKKQKLSTDSHSNTEQIYDNLLFQEDGFDLTEPLNNWKMKLSKKMPKRKRICSSGRTVRSEHVLSVKLEPITGSESFGFANRDLLSQVCAKRDYPESESFEVPSSIAFTDVLEPNCDSSPDEVLVGHVNKNEELVLYEDVYQEYSPDSSKDIETDGCDSCQQVLGIEECHNCSLDEDFYDQLEPIPLLEVSTKDIVYGSGVMMGCQPCVGSSTPESDTNDNSDNMFSSGTLEIVMPHKAGRVSESIDDSHVLNETSGATRSSPGFQAFDRAVNTGIETIDPLPPVIRTESFSMQQSLSSLDSHECSNHEDESVSTSDGTDVRDKSRAFSSTDTANDCWSLKNHFPSNLPTSEKQHHETVIRDSSSSSTETSLGNHTLSAPVLQIPGRLTRKIIPPTSQERLCLSMNCEELHNDADDYECKEKLFLEENIKSNLSIINSNAETAGRAENTAHLGQLNQRKVVISPSRILQKEKKDKRGSPPKGNLEKPFYSRSLPCINTACTSVKSCSKGAIAFSQRQMHDVDSLAGKLLNELISMKGILEQKLLLNSCRNLSLRNDADEVVAAIKTATRVEESAKRSLSLMARDCNRFCKIMSLTQDGPSSPENEIPRERRKIVFADEAGERLCHVKFFEDDTSTSICPNDSKEPSPKMGKEGSDPLDHQNVNDLH